jgi:hypothetical protein
MVDGRERTSTADARYTMMITEAARGRTRQVFTEAPSGVNRDGGGR